MLASPGQPGGPYREQLSQVAAPVRDPDGDRPGGERLSSGTLRAWYARTEVLAVSIAARMVRGFERQAVIVKLGYAALRDDLRGNDCGDSHFPGLERHALVLMLSQIHVPGGARAG